MYIIFNDSVLITSAVKMEAAGHIGEHPQHYTGQEPRRPKFEFKVP
jgi:hypothetical protein